MATKTITVTEEAYIRLARLKKENESFSETINRITGKRNIMEFFGILSKEAADELEKNIIENRKRHRQMRKKRYGRLFKDF
ncbi:MAG: antitoxin VapB family protein [Nanoarchaeota archaeon]